VTDARELAEAGARVHADVSLADLTTLRVGGPARLVAECRTTDALVAVLRSAAGKDSLLVGGGSNLLVSDEGVDGVVVLAADAGIELGPDSVVAQAGAEWDAVVAATVEAGLGGLECLSGIPGSAGATPVQNVGAYGVEVAQLLRRAQVLDRATGEVSWVAPHELGFGYRTSVLKGRHAARPAVVLAVEFALAADGLSRPVRYRELASALGAAEGDRLPAARVRAAVLALRAGKGMVLDPADHDTWSAGSFFTNPVVDSAHLSEVVAAITKRIAVAEDTIPKYPAGGGGVKLSAGWLIERAGFPKGYPGAHAVARLSTKHTLALTNRGAAKASDIVELARVVRGGVRDAFGIELESEPVTVGVDL